MPAIDNCDRDLLWLDGFYPLATEDQREAFTELVAKKWIAMRGRESNSFKERQARIDAMKEIFGART